MKTILSLLAVLALLSVSVGTVQAREGTLDQSPDEYYYCCYYGHHPVCCYKYSGGWENGGDWPDWE